MICIALNHGARSLSKQQPATKSRNVCHTVSDRFPNSRRLLTVAPHSPLVCKLRTRETFRTGQRETPCLMWRRTPRTDDVSRDCSKECRSVRSVHAKSNFPQNLIPLLLPNFRILQGGFKIGGQKGHQVANGHALGYGIYLAENASMSVQYALGGNRIFACRGTKFTLF